MDPGFLVRGLDGKAGSHSTVGIKEGHVYVPGAQAGKESGRGRGEVGGEMEAAQRSRGVGGREAGRCKPCLASDTPASAFKIHTV